MTPKDARMTTENATKQEVIGGSEDQEVGIREAGFRFGKSGPGLWFSKGDISILRIIPYVF